MNARSSWLRRRPETFWVQLGLGWTTFAWGAYVVVVDASLENMPVYDEAVKFVPAWAWGRLALFIGIAQIGCALGGLRWRKLQDWPRRLTGLLGMVFWKVLAVSMLNSGQESPMAIALCGVALMNLPVVLLPLLRTR